MERRTFLRWTGGTLVGAGVLACSRDPLTSTLPGMSKSEFAANGLLDAVARSHSERDLVSLSRLLDEDFLYTDCAVGEANQIMTIDGNEFLALSAGLFDGLRRAHVGLRLEFGEPTRTGAVNDTDTLLESVPVSVFCSEVGCTISRLCDIVIRGADATPTLKEWKWSVS
jgi:hypothetical protein